MGGGSGETPAFLFQHRGRLYCAGQGQSGKRRREPVSL